MIKRFVSSPENLEILEALVKRLTDLEKGQILTNKDIENLAKNKRYLVDKARNTVQQQTGCAFATVIGQGIKKLNPGNAHLIGENARQSATRKLSKARTVVVGVLMGDTNALTGTERRKMSDEIARLGLAIEFTEAKK